MSLPNAPCEAEPLQVVCTECGKKLKVRAVLAGKKVKCPKCGEIFQVKTGPPAKPRPAPVRRVSIFAGILLTFALVACGVYANLSFTVTNRANLKYFPPFEPFVDQNMNYHLGAEYFNIAKAMVAGQGFANPFYDQTGPTAWMPPVLPTVLAGIILICDGNRDLIMAVFVFLQVYVLVLTGLLVLSLARQSTWRLGSWTAALIFFIWVCNDFHLCYQFTHDCWIVMLAVDLMIAGFCWFNPLGSKKAAALWGMFGGLFAMTNPIVGFTWGVLNLGLAYRQRSWSRLAIAMTCAALTLTPWTVRNYLLFGRIIPVKSNVAYELYQSQVLLPDGLLQPRAFSVHPYVSGGRERQDYRAMGEMAFLDKKSELFWKSVKEDPLDYADRVASRFLGVTLWYMPFNRGEESRRTWVMRAARLTHPLPFIGLLILAFTAVWIPLHWYQWVVMGVYVFYLSPYIAVSYYDRYALPVLGVKALLVIWGVDRLLSLGRKQTAVAGVS